MLPNHSRLWIVNRTGVALSFTGADSFTITAKGKKLTDGDLDYGAEETWFPQPAQDLADGAALASATVVDNGSNKHLEADCLARLNAGGATAGNLEIYREISTDGGTTWPSSFPQFRAETDLDLVGVINASAGSGERGTNFAV